MRITVFILSILSFFTVVSQDGTYFIENYSPLEYNGNNQVWSIVQDNRGVMYFASDQIIEYDGKTWRKIKIPNTTVVRSLAIDTITNIIYVGAINEFGYLLPDETGQLVYNSISDKLDSNITDYNDIWKIEIGKDGAYFSTNTALFRYSLKDEIAGKNPITVWRNSNSFFLLYKVYNRIFTGVRGQGIVEVINDSLVPLKHGENEQLGTWFMFPYNENKILIGNSGTGLQVYNPLSTAENFLFKDPFFNKQYIDQTDKIIYKSQLYSGAYLGQNTYALGTINNGVLIVNAKGKITNIINKSVGLQNNTIHFLYRDRQGALWVAMTYGISRIEINTPITHFNDLSGIKGSIYNTIKNNSDIYASSNLGLFKLEKTSFIPVDGITGPNAIQCFGLANIKVSDSENEQLFAATTRAIYLIKNTKSKLIFPVESFEIVQPPKEKDIVFLSEGNNIFIGRYHNKNWSITDTIELDERASSLVFENKKRLWFIKNEKPNCIDFSNNYKNYSKTTDFSNEKTIKDISFLTITNLQDKIVFLADTGIYSYNHNIFYKDTTLYNGILNNEKQVVNIKDVNSNETWVNIKYDRKKFIKIIEFKNNKYTIDSISFRRLPIIEDFVNDGDSIMWIISANTLYKVDMNLLRTSKLANKEIVLNRMVKINKDSVIFKGTYFKKQGNIYYVDTKQTNNTIPKISYQDNNLTFEYALTSYNDESKNEYSYCLVRNNEDEVWSNWSFDTKKEFTNLFEGRYKFKVKARNIYKHESQISTYTFVVSPPWYRSVWAYLIYFILSVLFIWIILKIYTRKLKNEKELLEKIVRERTQEIWEKKEEITQQAEELRTTNDSLILKNEEINQQNSEIEAQRDNLQELTEDLKYRNEEINAQKEKLEIINNDIHDSIEYALRIQRAALPKKKILNKYVDDSFVFYKPKDLVSGDFYWFSHVEQNTVITAADCTGHGVPGALMSILGLSIIKEIVEREYITHPGVILRKMRKGIISALNQSPDSIEKDGMDMSLISINHDEQTISYAGAFNPLYIVRPIQHAEQEYDFMQEKNKNHEFVLYEIKPDKMPISIYPKMDRFKTHEFNYKKGDILYLFSDGFPDQFGGEKGKKFKYKPFQKLLVDIADKPMNEQEKILNSTFENWKGKLSQVDDIVVIGIKL